MIWLVPLLDAAFAAPMAALERPDGTVWMLRPDGVHTLDTSAAAEGDATSYADVFGGWTPPSEVDAAFLAPFGKTYLFFGSQYVLLDNDTLAPKAGYPKEIQGHWPGLPWSDGLDAVLSRPDGYAYFFRGDEYVKYNMVEDHVVDGYPKPISGNWDSVESSLQWAAMISPTHALLGGSAVVEYDMKGDKTVRTLGGATATDESGSQFEVGDSEGMGSTADDGSGESSGEERQSAEGGESEGLGALGTLAVLQKNLALVKETEAERKRWMTVAIPRLQQLRADLAAGRNPNAATLAAVQSWWHLGTARPTPSQLDQALAIIVQNRDKSGKVYVTPGMADPRCSGDQPDDASKDNGEQGSNYACAVMNGDRIYLRATWTTQDLTCRTNILTHEYYHLVGLDHGKTASHPAAWDSCKGARPFDEVLANNNCMAGVLCAVATGDATCGGHCR